GVARARVLDVHRDERRSGRARTVRRQHQQPQFRRAPGTGCADFPRQPADRRSGGSRRRHRRPAGASAMTVLQPFRKIDSRTAVLARADIDTDQIIPARYLKGTTRAGLGRWLFAGWRYDEQGRPRADFPLSRPEARGAQVLVAGANFGCGSSREHAPWALLDYGVGPEVTAEAVRVLTAVGELYGHAFDLREAPVGGVAIERTGVPLPDETIALCRGADAVLLGAVGGPRWGPSSPVRPEQGLLELRRALGVFANLRPASPHPRVVAASPLKPAVLRGVDVLIVRE